MGKRAVAKEIKERIFGLSLTGRKLLDSHKNLFFTDDSEWTFQQDNADCH